MLCTRPAAALSLLPPRRLAALRCLPARRASHSATQLEVELCTAYRQALSRQHYAAALCELARSGASRLGSPRGLALLSWAAATRAGHPDAMLRFCGAVAAPALAQLLRDRASTGEGPRVSPARLAQLALACEPGGPIVLLRAFRAAQRLGLEMAPERHTRALNRAIRALSNAGEVHVACELYADFAQRTLTEGGPRSRALVCHPHLVSTLCIAAVKSRDPMAARAVTSLVGETLEAGGGAADVDALMLTTALGAAAVGGDSTFAVHMLERYGFGLSTASKEGAHILWLNMAECEQQRALANCLTAIARESRRRRSEEVGDEMARLALRVWRGAIGLGTSPNLVCHTAILNVFKSGPNAADYSEAVINAVSATLGKDGKSTSDASSESKPCTHERRKAWGGELCSLRTDGDKPSSHERVHRPSVGPDESSLRGQPSMCGKTDVRFLNSTLDNFAHRRRADLALQRLREAAEAGEDISEHSIALFLNACSRDERADGAMLLDALRQAEVLVQQYHLGPAQPPLRRALLMMYKRRLPARTDPPVVHAARDLSPAASAVLHRWQRLVALLGIDVDAMISEADGMSERLHSMPML